MSSYGYSKFSKLHGPIRHTTRQIKPNTLLLEAQKVCSMSKHAIVTSPEAFFALWNQWTEDPESLFWENEYPVTAVEERNETFQA